MMPVYNAAEYLAESIESILAQTFSDFDFYIINDGSTDDSSCVIKKYERVDQRIKVIDRHNKGVSYSLNEAIALSDSTYIARMDADDISSASRFEMQIDYLENHPEVDVLGTRIIPIGDAHSEEKRKIQTRYGTEVSKESLQNDFLRENLICHPSVMMKRSFIQMMHGYRSTYKLAEDYDLWMRGIKEGFIIQNLQEELLQYRIHKDSVVKKNIKNNKLLKDLINIRLDFLRDHFISTNYSYMIWGAGTGGEVALQILQERLTNGDCLGFIDSYKQGDYLKYKVYSPAKAAKMKFDYCFIATSPGKEFAEQNLIKQGFIPQQHFFYLV
ncbi:glycosyltransferase involved in cell wall biosynthesis [Gracilibacillus alcaliphilus]|nr:glycosyltransferase involved in cell wall biosynthesis [Gracilibacillus alcaliphilus]